MCGRIVQCSPINILLGTFRITHYEDDKYFPCYNIPPPSEILAVRLNPHQERELCTIKWGFVPHWANDLSGPKPIDSRAETVASNGMFRDAFKQHRCLVPVDAFYEWQTTPQGEQPYCYRREDKQPFGIAAMVTLCGASLCNVEIKTPALGGRRMEDFYSSNS